MKICIIPEYPMNLMTGGLQVQAEESCQALNDLGGEIQAELFNWSEHRPLADLYHFCNYQPYLNRVTDLIRDAGRPYVITKLFGGHLSSAANWIARACRLVKSQLLRQFANQNTLHGASAIVTITESDAGSASIIFGLERSKIHVVPHGIREGFYSPSPAAWHQAYGQQPFILCVGAIQPRKGQRLLVQAGNRQKLPVVLLGPVLPGQNAYGAEVAAAMKENATYGGRWLQQLRNEDPLLLSAYAGARLYVLLSESETQPISVLQAMAAGKPTLLQRAPYTNEPPFHDARKVDGREPGIVAAAIQQAWNDAKPTTLAADFSWPGVARKLKNVYTGALAQTAGPKV